MAKEDTLEKSESTFLNDIRKADTKIHSDDWKETILYKVENFRSYTDNEKSEMFDYLRIDLDMTCKREAEFKTTIEDLKTQINVLQSENKSLKDDKLELESKVYAS